MVLINQFRILAKLYPEDETEYENKIIILPMGFTKNYDWLMPLENDEMSDAEGGEVFEILEMFRAIHDSKANEELTEKEKAPLTFRGLTQITNPVSMRTQNS